MSAFNARLKPKEVFGMPVVAAIGLVTALVFGVLSMLLPWFLKVVTLPIALAGIAAAGFAFAAGDDLQWLRVRFAAIFEDGCVTSEIHEEEI